MTMSSLRAVPFLLAGAVALVFGTAPADPAGDLVTARNLQSRKQWAASESLATAALARLGADHSTDSLGIAEASYLIGNAHFRQGGYADGVGIAAIARSLGIRQRRLGADHLKVAESHLVLGTYLVGTDRLDSARVHARRALDIRSKQLAPDDTLLADSWDQLALIQRDSRRYREAIEAWNGAIAVRKLRNGEEHPETALLLAQTGICWAELRDLDRAREVLQRSLDILARTAPDHPRRWIPLNLLADVEGRSGNLAREIDLTQEALRVALRSEASNPRPILTLRYNLAADLFAFGDYAGALAIYRELVPRVQAQFGASHWRTLMTLEGLGIAYEGVGDTAAAMRIVSAVEDSFAARGRAFDRFRSKSQLSRSTLLYKQGRHRDAAVMAERALRTELLVPNPEPLALANILNAIVWPLEALGDVAALDSLYPRMKPLTEQHGNANSRDFLLFARARAARALGRAEEAWAQGLEAEQTWRENARLSMRALPDRRGLDLTTKQRRYLDLVLDLSSRGPADWRATAWDRLVRTRGMVRAESARRRAPAQFDADTALVAAHARWIGAQRRLAQRLVSSPGRDSTTRRALDQLRAEADEAEAAYARTLSSHGGQLPPADAGLEDVRSRLKPGQALVSFCEVSGMTRFWLRADAGRDTSRVIAFIGRGGENDFTFVDVARSSALRSAIDPWRERLAASPGPGARAGDRAERECRRWGQTVRALTWDRIASHLAGVSDVFVVSDGPLADLPWHALPDGAKDYLVEAGPRLHLLNAERELVEPGRAPESGSLLAIGAPDFERLPSGASGAPVLAAVVRAAPDPCADGTLAALGPLPGSGAEAEAVGRLWQESTGHDASILLGRDASESAFKAAAKGRAILHLATHGVVARDTCLASRSGERGVGGVEPIASAMRPRTDPKKPAAAETPPAPSRWMSRRVWLALAGANHAREHDADENEGLLTAEEVLTLDLEGTDWVVLSACHSGLAESWSREGALGMRRAFDLAGARTVIASQWSVEDEATREWMTALYRARAGGATGAAQAIESASRSVLAERRGARRSTHPFYWAAFTPSGE